MDEDWLKLEIQNGHEEAVLGLFIINMAHWPLDHNGDHRINVLLSYKINMLLSSDEVQLKLEIQNGCQEAVLV